MDRPHRQPAIGRRGLRGKRWCRFGKVFNRLVLVLAVLMLLLYGAVTFFESSLPASLTTSSSEGYLLMALATVGVLVPVSYLPGIYGRYLQKHPQGRFEVLAAAEESSAAPGEELSPPTPDTVASAEAERSEVEAPETPGLPKGEGVGLPLAPAAMASLPKLPEAPTLPQ